MSTGLSTVFALLKSEPAPLGITLNHSFAIRFFRGCLLLEALFLLNLGQPIARGDDAAAKAVPTVPALRQAANGSLSLTARSAHLNGSDLKLEKSKDPYIDFWSRLSDFLSWPVDIAQTGMYRVELTYSSDPSVGTKDMTLSCNSETLSFRPLPTANWSTYRTVNLGEMNLTPAGKTQVSLKVDRMAGNYVMNFKQLSFVPAYIHTNAEDLVPTIDPDSNGDFKLDAIKAEIVGNGASYESGASGTDVGSWTDTGTYLRWHVNFTQPGKYHVSWLVANDPGNTPLRLRLKVGDDASLDAENITSTGWEDYKTADLGDITIDAEPGQIDVTLKAVSLSQYACNIRSITLTRIHQ